jgi:hypothetical protein
MKFIKHPNDQYVIAKRVDIQKEKAVEILKPYVTGQTIEPVAMG